MYIILILLLLAVSLALLLWGVARRRVGRAVLGVALAGATILFFWGLSFYAELLWFESLGYSERFWTMFVAQVVVGLVGAVAGAACVALLTYSIGNEQAGGRFVAPVVGAVIGGLWGLGNWETVLRFLNRASTGTVDPIFHRDVGYYLFTLPFYDALLGLLVFVGVVALAANGVGLLVQAQSRFSAGQRGGLTPAQMMAQFTVPAKHSVYAAAAAMAFILAWGKYLARYHMMYSTSGVVHGPGWTDVNVVLPAYWVVLIVTAAFGVVLAVPSWRRRWSVLLTRKHSSARLSLVQQLGTVAGTLVVVWILALEVVPGLVQWLYVEPSEITVERPYINHNIEFTRKAFKLDTAEEREFPVAGRFTRQMVDRNPGLFNNVRLWDWRALMQVYQQFQEIRLYYRFTDVDIDRYHIGGDYRQVMVSAREMDMTNLPAQSQTFVNRRFIYTHGYGITLCDVSKFTPEGLPNLLVSDMPVRSAGPELELDRPQIYYGELMSGPVVVNSSEAEFDYPAGDENEYIHYPGKGGVNLGSLWRKFVFGWEFDGTRFLMSSYPREGSRVMFHREIRERVKTLAPFLDVDEDPYIVMADGRLYWILDTYVKSTYYPYSQAFWGEGLPQFRGARYLRNSVKVVVDAFEGSVDLYVFDDEDPIIKVWGRIFDDLLQPASEMPAELRAHVRYPSDLLFAQGLVYAEYHMTDPAVFYNQEDLWVRATESYYGYTQYVDPYYIMWKTPESEELEFILMQPFTPKERQVLIGWLAGMCDGEDYGRLLVYKFPKGKRVLGTQQVESKIDQDAFLSAQLSLWDQRGSNVIRGNVLVIPVENTIMYVEPIYLQAETAAYPELRLVIVMHQNNMSYGTTFEEALEGLFAERRARAEPAALPGLAGVATLAEQANEAFNRFLQSFSDHQFDISAEALESLQSTLSELVRTAGVEEAPADTSGR